MSWRVEMKVYGVPRMQRTNRGRRGAVAIALAGPLMLLPATTTPAKTPGSTYCFLKTCHRVKTIEETQALVGKTLVMHASYYDDAGRDGYNPSNLTSSGEYFQSGKPDNAASPVLPDGTKVLVWHPGSKRAIIVRINNAGPYWGSKRLIDLSRAGAERLGFTHSGVATVHVKVLEAPTRAEATYRRGRAYDPVPGYIGAFASADEALSDAGRRLAKSFERNVPEAVASAEAALAKLLALQGDHDAGNTAPALTTVLVAEVPPPAEMGGSEGPPAMLVAELETQPGQVDRTAVAAPATVGGLGADGTSDPGAAAVAALMLEEAPEQIVSAPVAAAAPSTEVKRVAATMTAPASPVGAPVSPSAPDKTQADQVSGGNPSAAAMKLARNPEGKPAAQPRLKSAAPTVARAEPKPPAKPAVAVQEPEKGKTKLAGASKPAKLAAAVQTARKPSEEGDDTPSASAKLAHLAQAPRPVIQPSPVKIPQAAETELDRRAWFRTALSLN